MKMINCYYRILEYLKDYKYYDNFILKYHIMLSVLVIFN